ncbi:MAG: helix-turn-helix transcriptional regulator [Deltaproteobacteria bacterium]|nr:helix-turn-helix transcriptional regulator [Deltaproteobacteria bacterium]
MYETNKSSKYLLKTPIINTLLLSKGIRTHKELAEKVELKPATISQLFNRKIGASLDVIRRFCKLLDCEPWQIADGFEAVPTTSPTGVVKEGEAPYNIQAFKIYNLGMAKLEQAGLSEDELKTLGGVIGRIIDIFSTKDAEKRHQHINAISGIIDLCHQTLFQQGGGAGELSLSKKGNG